MLGHLWGSPFIVHRGFSIQLTLFQLRLDAEELRKLLASAERQKVKDILSLLLRKLETEITQLEEKSKQEGSTTAAAPKPKSTTPRVPTVDIKTYGI